MKKIIAVILSTIMLVMMLPISAFAASGSMSGPSSARAGETISVTFKVSGGNFSGYSGTLSYDSSVLTLVSASSNLGGSWAFSRNGNNIVAYDTTGNSSVSGSLFTVKFKVNSGVATGSAMKVGFNGTVSDGTDYAVSGNYSGTVAAPLSNDATLSNLVVGNATLSPAFNPNTTNYSCGTVTFDVAKLSVSATANASGAKISVNGSNLSVGKNTVRIVVTAPSGAQKTYTITVTRQQDPNYKPSNNTNLSGITLSAGTLSPEYAVDVKEYVVYVPFETGKITIDGAAADPKAKGVVGVTDAELQEGDNKFEIKCTAEDDSEGVYIIHVVRMPEFKAGMPIITSIAAEETTAPDTETKQDEELKNQTVEGISPILVVVLAVICLFLGFAISFLIFKKKLSKTTEEKIEDYASDPNDLI